jgi:hypothetical protein
MLGPVFPFAPPVPTPQIYEFASSFKLKENFPRLNPVKTPPCLVEEEKGELLPRR